MKVVKDDEGDNLGFDNVQYGLKLLIIVFSTFILLPVSNPNR